MPRQPDLLGPPPLTVQPSAGQNGPRLWVKRLAIWQEPGGEKIRDISFRPGLNIIWSPDGGDALSTESPMDAIGHGSGKTLFCRLLRYCLGEDRYAAEDQRERVGVAFLNGIVGAEVMLDGVCWAILRPLGVREVGGARNLEQARSRLAKGRPPALSHFWTRLKTASSPPAWRR